jgi:hypothetical protein
MKKPLAKDVIYSTPEQVAVKEHLGQRFDADQGTTENKLGTFMKYVTRQEVSLFLARYEIFKQILDVKGSVVECGVYYGNGLMTFAQFSAALEPFNYNRRVIGFDTFSGNKGWSNNDKPSSSALTLKQVDYAVDSKKSLEEIIKIFDSNRALPHIPKIELVKGDITETIPQYLKKNRHLLVSLLSLSVNLYEPTKAALKYLVPRMSKGSIIAVHTLNEGVFPGVTCALLEEAGIKGCSIRSVPYAPNLSYVVL